MSLLRYFRVRGWPLFYILVFLSSLYISALGLTVDGIYRVASSETLPSENVYVVYDRGSSTPFSGLVPLGLALNISRIDGVLAVSPEVVVPVAIGDRHFVLRGVTSSFFRVSNITVVEGGLIDLDRGEVLLGIEVAGSLGVKVGDSLMLAGVLGKSYLEVVIAGIFRSGSVLDEEIVAPLFIGQWLRGSDYNYVTMIRVLVDPQLFDPSEIEGLWGRVEAPSEAELSILPLRAVKVRPGAVGSVSSGGLLESYLRRYGLSYSVINVALFSTGLLAGLATIYATIVMGVLQGRQSSILISIGASSRRIKLVLFSKLATAALAAMLMGLMAAIFYTSLSLGSVKVLYHGIRVVPSVGVVVSEAVIFIILVAMGVWLWSPEG